MIMYFDPGTGSLIIQMLLACIAGVTSFFMMFKTNIITFFSKKEEKKSTKGKKEVTKE